MVKLTREDVIKSIAEGNKDFIGLDLSGLDLNCINLEGTNLKNVNFYNANLQGVNLWIFRVKVSHFDSGMDIFSPNFLKAIPPYMQN